ncbi:uncharacterized protein LOC106162568 [Lingula anatina]|uniref:Uncharacterized protein LOC106162568 n=1 Tax=Lingula anatina TaxID=7574 RepID=A0A1S3IAQ0_LINAN|nr:uncharacterized protein LOC106162568 [Lingula anatina]|eukprot:XP_013395337.1 uncharacterized protein LOC106162568 [Lingula anatina]
MDVQQKIEDTETASLFSSFSTSSTEARLKAKAKIETELTSFEVKKNLDEQELKLKQLREKLKLDTERTKLLAEETAYAEAEMEFSARCCAVVNLEDGYKKAKALLKERFGSAYTITETWVKKITTGSAIKANDVTKLRDFADELRTCAETLEAMGNSSELSTQSSLVKITERLPGYLEHKWKQEVRKIRKEGRCPDIKDVTAFVVENAEIANDPVYGGLAHVKRSDSRSDSQRRPNNRWSYSITATSLQPIGDTRKSIQSPCIKCGSIHSLFGCTEFKAMKLPERLKFANDNKLCYNCLKPGHFSEMCRLQRTCSV